MKNKSIKTLSVAALIAALTFVGTGFFKMPIPGTGEYVHAGDGFVLLGALLLPPGYAALAGAVGAAMADLLSPYAMWTPWTFAIKGISAYAAARIAAGGGRRREWIGSAAFLVLNTGGYWLAGCVLYGPPAALVALPFTFFQSVVGVVLSRVCRAPCGHLIAGMERNRKEM